MSQTLLEKIRDSKTKSEEKIDLLIKEICLFDSVHDFDTIFYDKIPKLKSLDEGFFGDFKPALFSGVNFSYVCDTISPYKNNSDFFIALQENNRISAGAYGSLTIQAAYTKSSIPGGKPRIEQYYLDKAIEINKPIKVTINSKTSDEEAYKIILNELKDYATLETDGKKYIPIIIDVQKRLLSVLRSQSLKNHGENLGIELAYCSNREMSNDAAGKLDFRQPVKQKGLNFFVDVDKDDINYKSSDKIFTGYKQGISFSKMENLGIVLASGITDDFNILQRRSNPPKDSTGKINKRKSVVPWCNVSCKDNGENEKKQRDYVSILNDSLNSKSNTNSRINKIKRENITTFFDIQNKYATLKTPEFKSILNNPKDFLLKYKSDVIKEILKIKDEDKILKEISDEIYFFFTRKRLGDQLQALSCLKSRYYSKIEIKNNIIECKKPVLQDKVGVFCSYDVIACAFAIANKIPVILETPDPYEKKGKNMVLYIPNIKSKFPIKESFGGSRKTSLNVPYNLRSLKESLKKKKYNVDENLIKLYDDLYFNINERKSKIKKIEAIINEENKLSKQYLKTILDINKSENHDNIYNQIKANPKILINICTFFSRFEFGKLASYCNNILDNINHHTYDIYQYFSNDNNKIVNSFIDYRIIDKKIKEDNEVNMFSEDNKKYIMINVKTLNIFRAGAIPYVPTISVTWDETNISEPKIFVEYKKTGGEKNIQKEHIEAIVENLYEGIINNETMEKINEQLILPKMMIITNIIGSNNMGGGSRSTLDKKELSINIFQSLILNCKNFLEKTEFRVNEYLNCLLLKVISTFEFRLVFNNELYQNYYTETNYAENNEMYCLFEILKDHNINIILLINTLNKIKNKNSFASKILDTLAEIYDFVFNSSNHMLIKIFDVNEDILPNEDIDIISIINSAENLFEQNPYLEFKYNYFTDLYFDKVDDIRLLTPYPEMTNSYVLEKKSYNNISNEGYNSVNNVNNNLKTNNISMSRSLSTSRSLSPISISRSRLRTKSKSKSKSKSKLNSNTISNSSINSGLGSMSRTKSRSSIFNSSIKTKKNNF